MHATAAAATAATAHTYTIHSTKCVSARTTISDCSENLLYTHIQMVCRCILPCTKQFWWSKIEVCTSSTKSYAIRLFFTEYLEIIRRYFVVNRIWGSIQFGRKVKCACNGFSFIRFVRRFVGSFVLAICYLFSFYFSRHFPNENGINSILMYFAGCQASMCHLSRHFKRKIAFV